ncbi:glycosyltransferase family 9 protein [Janthinobacterium agaricidamnosum]|uniref:glycosyltransferase family 9 protein n=1 Tax=Janthinobacterium agaricidamnosum TaxID=55508 RepID=UPI00068C96CC|nr:glycosyltransferase family 9 protein [Janthinobacterium agaricidamnosum]
MKHLYPGVRIDFLCRAYAAPVVRHCRFVDHVVTVESLEDDPQAYFAASGADTVVFAFPKRQLAQAAKKAGILNRVATSHRLYHWFFCNKLAHFSRARSMLHETQLNLKLLQGLCIKSDLALDRIPAFYGLSAPSNAMVDALFDDHPFNLVLHPKSNGNGREWPIAHYAELARLLQADAGIHVWITGSMAEGEWLATHGTALLRLPNVTNLCGKFDLDGLLALIGASDGLVASGTGPLHIAAALGRPTLGLFPPIKPIDITRWGALGERAASMESENKCGKCLDVNTCSCMQAIIPARVQQAVLAWRHQATAPLALAGDAEATV